MALKGRNKARTNRNRNGVRPAQDPNVPLFKDPTPRSSTPYKQAMTKKLGTSSTRVGPPVNSWDVSFTKMKRQKQTIKNFRSGK